MNNVISPFWATSEAAIADRNSVNKNLIKIFFRIQDLEISDRIDTDQKETKGHSPYLKNALFTWN
jgi:hypothetical protein